MERKVELYICYLWRIVKGLNVDGVEPDALKNFGMIYPSGQEITSDQYEELKIADKAIQTIQDGKNPFLKYDANNNLIYCAM